MSGGIDYSKWDHIDGASSSDEEGEEKFAAMRPEGPNVYTKSNASATIGHSVQFAGAGERGGKSISAETFKLAVGGSPKPFSVTFAVGEMMGVAEDNSLPEGSKVMIMSTQKRAVSLDLCHGVWNNKRLTPSGHLNVDVQINGEMILRCVHDNITAGDWKFMKDRAGSDAARREKIERLQKATKLCKEAMSLPPRKSGPCKRSALVEEAVRTSDICAWAYYMRFELLGVKSGKIEDIHPKGRLKKGKDLVKCLAALKDSIAAGRALIELVNANEIFLGKFYAWVPTRWLVRSTYMAACLQHLLGNLDEAERLFSECIGHDQEDNLGARNRQLLVCLDRGDETGLGTKHLKRLLKARFGDDNTIDDVLALQNYTRALNSFVMKGDRASSTELLKHAITKNPHVPPLILCWELPEPVHPLVEIFSKDEAATYAEDSRVHWEGVTDAMQWLEKTFRETRGGDACAVNRDMIRGMRLIVSATYEFPSKSAQEKENILSDAMALFKSAVKELRKDNSTLQYDCYDHMATCAYYLHNHALTVVNCNLALSYDDINIDKKKALIYTRAESKEKLNDLEGALSDFKDVWSNIGHFTSAKEGIERIEMKLNTQDPFLRPWTPPPGSTRQSQEEKSRSDSISREVEELCGKTAPNPSQNAEERCASCARWGITLKKCAGCGLVSYCGKACQTQGWRSHKRICRETRKKSKSN